MLINEVIERHNTLTDKQVLDSRLATYWKSLGLNDSQVIEKFRQEVKKTYKPEEEILKVYHPKGFSREQILLYYYRLYQSDSAVLYNLSKPIPYVKPSLKSRVAEKKIEKFLYVVDNPKTELDLKIRAYLDVDTHYYTSDDDIVRLLPLIKKVKPEDVNKIEYQISKYQANDYARLNNSLRAGKIPKAATLIDIYIKYMPKVRIKKCYRGISKNQFPKLTVGKTISDLAYMSCTTDLKIAKWFSERKGKGGSGVLMINGINGIGIYLGSKEDEILLPRNSKIQITDVSYTDGRYPVGTAVGNIIRK